MGRIKEINDPAQYDDDDGGYKYEDEADHIIESCFSDQQITVRHSHAVERIEQANLYLTLLNHQLFSAGSARPEIISSVEQEIKSFVLERLEVLLGLRQSSPTPVVQAPSDFSTEELSALKAIANRLIDKPTRNTPSPQIIPVQAEPAPIVKPPSIVIPTPQTSSSPQPKQNRGRKRAKPIEIRPPSPEEGNRGSDGTSYAQVASPSRKTMPTQAEMDTMNAMEVARTQQSFGNTQAGGLGSILGAAIQLAQQTNANIKEDDV